MKKFVCLLVCLSLIAPLTALALTEGRYTYTVVDGKATITDFDHSGFSFGPLAIPSTLGNKPVTAIGDNAFDNCTSLSGITIPGCVISIGNSAFKNCEYLASINIPDDVISIGDSAFEGCVYLTSVTIPEGVTIISEGTFAYCIRLTSVTIPESVHTIEESAFSWCGMLLCITIPSTVTSIGDAAFFQCSSLTSITIPDGITAIGSAMLFGCENLTRVTIPSSVTSIGQEAFRNCFSLPCVAIPADVTNIGTNAFRDCPELFSIYFAGNAPPIDHSPFYGSPVIIYYLDESRGWDDTPNAWNGRIARSVSFDYTARNGRANIVGCNRGSVGTLIIPTTLGGNTVNMISDSAFSNCTSLIQVTIPAGIPSIGSSAFNGCTSLTHISVHPDNSFYSSVDGVLFNKSQSTLFKCPEGKPGAYTIPASVTSITNTAFRFCTGLTDITLLTNITVISNYMFRDCSSLTGVTIPSTVTSIGSAAFLNCSSLTRIAIPASVTSIDTWAFRACSSLTGVYFAGNAPTIETAPFENTPATIYYFNNTTGWPSEGGLWAERPTAPINYTYTLADGKATLTGYSGADGAITIPDTLLGDIPVTAIGAEVFKNNTSLTSVFIPAGITSIDSTAFDGCTSVASFTVDTVNSFFSSVAGVLFNKSQSTLLLYPKGKPDIYDIPIHVTAIGDKAFKDCIGLTSVTIPYSVITIGNAIFQGCTSLTRVTFPDRMETITASMFFGCSSLTHITLPVYLKKIEFYAFGKCSGLISITLPDRITNIASYAFRYCNNLERVYFTNQPPITGNLAFDGTPATLYYLPDYSWAWGDTLAGQPTVLWNPTFAGTTHSAGQLALTITGTPDIPIALEANTDLASGEWIRLTTTELTSGSKVINDPDIASHPARFYRIVGP